MPKIINYDIESIFVEKPKSLRIYVSSNDYEQIKVIFENIISVVDSNITKNEINEVYSSLETVPSYNILPETKSLEGYITKTNIMLDIKNFDFID